MPDHPVGEVFPHTGKTMKLTTKHAKLLSFAYSASGVAWNRFCSLWLLKCGFSPRQVGAMKSLSLVGKLCAQPMWAGTADSSGNAPSVLSASIVLSMLALEALRLGTRGDYAEHEFGGPLTTSARHDATIPLSWLWTLLGLSSSSKERSHHAVAVDATSGLTNKAGDGVAGSIERVVIPAVSHHTTSSSQTAALAWKVAILRVARSSASAARVAERTTFLPQLFVCCKTLYFAMIDRNRSPVADAMVLALARDGGEAWGKQRFWGSASWGLGSVLVGAIIDRFGLEWGLFGVSHVMSLVLLLFLVFRIEPNWGKPRSAAAKSSDDDRKTQASSSAIEQPIHSQKTTTTIMSMKATDTATAILMSSSTNEDDDDDDDHAPDDVSRNKQKKRHHHHHNKAKRNGFSAGSSSAEDDDDSDDRGGYYSSSEGETTSDAYTTHDVYRLDGDKSPVQKRGAFRSSAVSLSMRGPHVNDLSSDHDDNDDDDDDDDRKNQDGHATPTRKRHEMRSPLSVLSRLVRKGRLAASSPSFRAADPQGLPGSSSNVGASHEYFASFFFRDGSATSSEVAARDNKNKPQLKHATSPPVTMESGPPSTGATAVSPNRKRFLSWTQGSSNDGKDTLSLSLQQDHHAGGAASASSSEHHIAIDATTMSSAQQLSSSKGTPDDDYEKGAQPSSLTIMAPCRRMYKGNKASSGSSKKKKKPRNVFVVVSRGLLAVRRCAPLRLALLNSVAFGTAVVSVDSILYMQLENELQVSRTLSGLATAASTAATFPVFWSSAELVSRYGHWRCIVFAQLVLPVRLLLHVLVTESNVTWLLPPIQLLHGPMFAAWISAAVELVDRLAPPDLRASTQSLLTMAYFTLGGCLGHLIWSTTFDLYGGKKTYLLAAVFSAVSVSLFAFAARDHLRLERARHHASTTTTTTAQASSSSGVHHHHHHHHFDGFQAKSHTTASSLASSAAGLLGVLPKPSPLASHKRHLKASDDDLRSRAGSHADVDVGKTTTLSRVNAAASSGGQRLGALLDQDFDDDDDDRGPSASGGAASATSSSTRDKIALHAKPSASSASGIIVA